MISSHLSLWSDSTCRVRRDGERQRGPPHGEWMANPYMDTFLVTFSVTDRHPVSSTLSRVGTSQSWLKLNMTAWEFQFMATMVE